MRWVLGLSFLAGVVGCSETGDFPIVGVADAPATACNFDKTRPTDDAVTFDTSGATMLRLPLIYENTTSKAIRPVKFDMAFECLESGFNWVGPFMLDAYSADRPFCKSYPDDDFVGFDVVDTTGARIEPGERGIAMVEVVPAMLGAAFDAQFKAAAAIAGCIDSATDRLSESEECQAVIADYEMSREPRYELLQDEAKRIAAFSIYDGAYSDAERLANGGTLPEFGAAFALNVAGYLIAVDDSGAEHVSSQGQLPIQICRNCGTVDGQGVREARVDSSCYH